jgi:Cof subfamily protein (haloacid dehalogenase superfamily)
MIKALFFDIDGTLVSFKTHIIPQSTVDAIAEAKKNGVRIYISTGRPISLITNLGQIEHLIDGYITTNGAYCFVDDETGRHTICCNDIPTEDIQMMLNAASKWDRPVIVVGQQDIAIYNYKDVVDDVFHKGLGVDNLDYDKPIEDVLIQPVLQMTPFISEEQEVELMSKMKNSTSGRWCPDFTDITCKAADKGKGLLAMAEHEGLAVADTMAFGDGGNDISIIRQAGIGVAMGNAGDEVKKNADFITTSVDEDGIMNALIKFGVI